ncbi:aminopeptidase P family protein [bacterium]|nr:aminopeptidase P family protein [bacterium]
MRRIVFFATLCLAVFFSAAAAQAIHPEHGRDLVEPQVYRGMQAYMLEKRFDAWIFTGQGAFDDAAREVLGLSGSTRHRWFIVLPGMATIKRPCLVYHPDDEKVFSGIKMYPLPYRSRAELEKQFTGYLYTFVRKAALNYSAGYNVPDLDQAGAGVVEWLKGMTFEVIPTGSMLSFFNTRWMLGHVDSHRAAAAALDSVLGRSVLWLGDRLAAGKKTTDRDLARQVESGLKKAGLESVAPVSVRLDSLTRTELASPDRKQPLVITRGSLIYLEASARPRKAELPMFARLGWTLVADTAANASLTGQWTAIVAAAQAALDCLEQGMGPGHEVLGYQVDDTARALLGAPDLLPRPLGFNLNPWGHSFGVQLDDWLAHDDREVMPGMGFSLEPGVWTTNYALRMCNNLFISAGPDNKHTVDLSAPLQRKIIPLLAGEKGLKEAFAAPVQ